MTFSPYSAKSNIDKQLDVLVKECALAQGERDTYKHLLLTLLAVIHRDGGHYTNEHGLEKSVEDAGDRFNDLLWRMEGLNK